MMNDSEPSLCQTPGQASPQCSTSAIAVSVKPSIRSKPINDGAANWNAEDIHGVKLVARQDALRIHSLLP